MNRNEYCDRVLAQVGRLTADEANDLRNELAGHIEDHAEALVGHGYDEEAAAARAVEMMGDPEETGKALRDCYRHFWLVIVQRIAIGSDVVQLNRIEYGVREGERQAVLWASVYDRIPGGTVYENLLETLVLESERGESMYPWLDGNYRSCTGSRGTLYVHTGRHAAPLKEGDTYVTLVYERFGERIETRIELPEGGTQP